MTATNGESANRQTDRRTDRSRQPHFFSRHICRMAGFVTKTRRSRQTQYLLGESESFQMGMTERRSRSKRNTIWVCVRIFPDGMTEGRRFCTKNANAIPCDSRAGERRIRILDRLDICPVSSGPFRSFVTSHNIYYVKSNMPAWGKIHLCISIYPVLVADCGHCRCQ